MYLKPSNLFYSQNSITYVFDKYSAHANKTIGNTLDDLCEGRCKISEIPPMRVTQKDGKWYSLDNRRLWLFHHLEAAGKCDKVYVVKECFLSDSSKFTTENAGTSITIVRESHRKRRNRPMIRESPGGRWHTKLIPVTPRIEEETEKTSRSEYKTSTDLRNSPENDIVPHLFSNNQRPRHVKCAKITTRAFTNSDFSRPSNPSTCSAISEFSAANYTTEALPANTPLETSASTMGDSLTRKRGYTLSENIDISSEDVQPVKRLKVIYK